jgi:uncharacterized protein YcbK (DUF882 family)
MKYKIKHFQHKEFICPCCGKIQVASALVFWLDMIRDASNLPLVITSGFRCVTHNREVGGSSMSRHLLGCAADIAIPKGTRYETLGQYFKRFSHEGTELIFYPDKTHIHFAVSRDEIRHLWSGSEVVNI